MVVGVVKKAFIRKIKVNNDFVREGITSQDKKKNYCAPEFMQMLLHLHINKGM